jgi:uncharacterized membrane protein
MRSYFLVYAIMAVAFLGLDFAWLSLTMKPLYRAHLGGLLMEKPDLLAAGVFYLLYPVGILVLAVMPSAAPGNWAHAVCSGAVLGVMAYGTYNMTNQATLNGWSATVSVVDTTWGGVATAVVSGIGYAVTKRFLAG